MVKNNNLLLPGQLQLVYGDGICTRRRDVLTSSKNWEVQVCAYVASVFPLYLAVYCTSVLGVFPGTGASFSLFCSRA